MHEIDRALPGSDGVAAFNRMYLRVTELVRDRLVEGWFGNPAFVTRLDLVFAGLYLDAVGAGSPDPSWQPLFTCRLEPGRVPIQFALAGMNAHINHDLPLAVVTTCRQLGLTPDSPGVEADYHRVNDLLAAVQEDVRRSFLDGIVLAVDEQYAGPVANLVSGWSIARARDAAWTNARVLWSLEGVEPLRTDFLATLVPQRRDGRALPADAGRRPRFLTSASRPGDSCRFERFGCINDPRCGSERP